MLVDEWLWPRQTFGHCDLGGVPKTRRLVDAVVRLARRAGQSLTRCRKGDPAAVLGNYRLIALHRLN